MQHAKPAQQDRDEAFWAQALTSQPFYVDGLALKDYEPAFRLGRARWRDDTLIDDVLARLGEEWDEVKGDSRLTWIEARHAVRAAWERCGRLAQQTVEV
jgi:alpha-mannosidase